MKMQKQTDTHRMSVSLAVHRKSRDPRKWSCSWSRQFPDGGRERWRIIEIMKSRKVDKSLNNEVKKSWWIIDIKGSRIKETEAIYIYIYMCPHRHNTCHTGMNGSGHRDSAPQRAGAPLKVKENFGAWIPVGVGVFDSMNCQGRTPRLPTISRN